MADNDGCKHWVLTEMFYQSETHVRCVACGQQFDVDVDPAPLDRTWEDYRVNGLNWIYMTV